MAPYTINARLYKSIYVSLCKNTHFRTKKQANANVLIKIGKKSMMNSKLLRKKC